MPFPYSIQVQYVPVLVCNNLTIKFGTPERRNIIHNSYHEIINQWYSRQSWFYLFHKVYLFTLHEFRFDDVNSWFDMKFDLNIFSKKKRRINLKAGLTISSTDKIPLRDIRLSSKTLMNSELFKEHIITLIWLSLFLYVNERPFMQILIEKYFIYL